MTTKPAAAAVAAVTLELQNFSPFTELKDSAKPPCPSAEGVGGATEERSFRPHPPCNNAGASAASEGPRAGTNGGPLDYGPYYVPAAQYYSGLAKEHSVESQDSSTLSSPPSDGLAPPPAPAGAAAPDSLFQFSIGKILEDEGAAVAPEVQGKDRELSGFYADDTGTNKGTPSPQLQPPEKADPEGPPIEQRQIRRVIMSVNDKWHYCHNSEVLVGSRAMRDRHLRLLGYIILPLPYHELEKLNGIEEVKQYLHKKLLDVPL